MATRSPVTTCAWSPKPTCSTRGDRSGADCWWTQRTAKRRQRQQCSITRRSVLYFWKVSDSVGQTWEGRDKAMTQREEEGTPRNDEVKEQWVVKQNNSLSPPKQTGNETLLALQHPTHLHHHLLTGVLLPILHSGINITEDGSKAVQPHHWIALCVLLWWNILL